MQNISQPTKFTTYRCIAGSMMKKFGEKTEKLPSVIAYQQNFGGLMAGFRLEYLAG